VEVEVEVEVAAEVVSVVTAGVVVEVEVDVVIVIAVGGRTKISSTTNWTLNSMARLSLTWLNMVSATVCHVADVVDPFESLLKFTMLVPMKLPKSGRVSLVCT
jgi:hypothetical protein